MKAYVYRPGAAAPEVHELPDGDYSSVYKQIKAWLDGGAPEHVSVLWLHPEKYINKRSDMFVDEVGQLKGLPRNDKATEIYRRATMLGRSAAPKPADPEELPWIAGTAIVFDRIIWR